jgi:hypothetical protein
MTLFEALERSGIGPLSYDLANLTVTGPGCGRFPLVNFFLKGAEASLCDGRGPEAGMRSVQASFEHNRKGRMPVHAALTRSRI